MTKFVDSLGLKRLVTKIAEAVGNGTWLPVKKGGGEGSIVMGRNTSANGEYSHAEGYRTQVSGAFSHVQGYLNYDDPSFISMVGVGDDTTDDIIRKNASVIYVGRDEKGDGLDPSDSKTGYQYLLGVGGYQGQAIDEGMKSVQEVIAGLEKGVAATETMTVEDIREIMSA